jgi:F-type H+-transporting ATPase subunit epsilon
MPDGTFTVEVVTPEADLFKGPARALMLRSSEGDFTVLDGHTRVVTDVVPGEVRVEQEDDRTLRFAVHGGYLQVDNRGDGPGEDAESAAGGGSRTRATLLAGVAERAEDIDVERAERARAEAEARLNELRSGRAGERAGEAPEEGATSGSVEVVQTEAALRRAEVRLEVAGAPAGGTGSAA